MSDVPGFADRFVLGMAQTALCGGLLAGIAWLVGKWLPMPNSWRAVMWWMVCARFVVGLICACFVPPSPALVVVVPPFWEVRLPKADNVGPVQTPLFPAPSTDAAQAKSTVTPKNEPVPAGNAALPSHWFNLPLFLLVVWLGVFLARTVLSAAQYAGLRKRARSARTVSGDAVDAPAVAFFQAASEAARHMNRPAALPRLLLSPSPCDPLVTGWRNPAVLLSQTDAARLSHQELTLVLLHEMAHLRRRDLFWGMLPHFALHLFWFWPLAHFACREWSLACEAACDGEAARMAQTSPHQYGELLLKLGAAQTASPTFAALPVSVHFRLLQRRLVMLNSSFSTAPASPRRRIVSALGTAALLAAALPLALLPLRFAAFAAAADAPYTKINGDTGKPWADYPDAPRNLNFANGLTGWQQGKHVNSHYSIAVQEVKAPTAGPSLVLQAASAVKGEEGFLAQHARPNPFRGKRVRFSGWVKAEAAQGVDFWLRMDTPTWQKAWNKMDVPLSGNIEWTKMEYVFDVPSDAQGLSFGTYLAGSGKVWLHDPAFEMVDKSIPVSVPAFDSSPEASTKKGAHADRSFAHDFDNPANLDFKNGLAGWWNDNPDHNAEQGYAISLDNRAAP